MNLDELDAPFASEDIEWRIQQAGKNNNGIWAKVLAYVTNRAIMKRLDEVCGKAGWRNEYRDIGCIKTVVLTSITMFPWKITVNVDLSRWNGAITQKKHGRSFIKTKSASCG